MKLEGRVMLGAVQIIVPQGLESGCETEKGVSKLSDLSIKCSTGFFLIPSTSESLAAPSLLTLKVMMLRALARLLERTLECKSIR